MTTWNAAFEISPADADQAKYGAGKIRELKTAISERMDLEHNFSTGGAPSHIVGKVAAVKVDTTANIAAVSGPSAGAIAWDTTLNQFKVYDGANWVVRSVIPTGTKALFYQDVAPTGWTIQNTLDDKVVFITKGSAAGGQTGGGAHSTGSWTISGIAADSHVLTTAEMPAHTHLNASYYMGAAEGSFNVASNDVAALPNVAYATSSTGGGGGHVHTVTHTPAWRPAAYCCIICAKD